MNAENLADFFQERRGHLKAVAYRILGSAHQAEDAVQETWLKADRADLSGIENPAAWLTTVIGRVCLDMLRARRSRREEPMRTDEAGGHRVRVYAQPDPAERAVLEESVGLAMLVVLDALTPVERLAFVLHDMFGVPFADIAPIVERSPETTQRIASRARARVRGRSTVDGDRVRRYRAVEAFLRAARNGEFESLLALLDPDVTYRADAAARTLGAAAEASGSRMIAAMFNGEAGLARAVMLDGRPGVVVAPHGRMLMVMTLEFDGDRIAAITAVADEAVLAAVELTLPA